MWIRTIENAWVNLDEVAYISEVMPCSYHRDGNVRFEFKGVNGYVDVKFPGGYAEFSKQLTDVMSAGAIMWLWEDPNENM